jgi:hypothetical protein
MVDPARLARRAEPFRHDAFTAQHARIDDRAVALEVVIENNAVTLQAQAGGQRFWRSWIGQLCKFWLSISIDRTRMATWRGRVVGNKKLKQ